MSARGEIKSEKILVKDIFSRMWFRIPEYQRPFIWGTDEVSELLDDLAFAMIEKPDFDYFLGSFVFQSRVAAPELGQKFNENDLLDGQQRMTTLLLLFAVIRDLTENVEAKETCQKCIYQKANTFLNIPDRTRLFFAIREDTQRFLEDDIIREDGTAEIERSISKINKKENISIRNMANAIIVMSNFFRNNPKTSPEELLHFLLNNVLMIYVSTEDLEDAFRLFTILNDRGIPLRNSDILKSMNLGALNESNEKIKYAKMWEEAESELGDDFDRFLNHIRTILVKDKPRLNLLKEFEDKIYNPKEREKSTGALKPVLLHKGQETFELIERYLSHYHKLFDGQTYDELNNFEFDNHLKVMLTGLPATDWMPPLIRYFDRFQYQEILNFLKRLDNKFSADWISQYSPTDRIEAMNKIIRVIDDAKNVQDVFSSKSFDIDGDSLIRFIDGPVYGRRFARYLLLKLDYIYTNHAQRMNFETPSVEHILPQNPAANSQWLIDFDEGQRKEWTDKLGNLVLITGRKNSTLGRLNYQEKKKRYFERNIDTCPNSLRVLTNYEIWTPNELRANHEIVLNKIKEHYGIR
ncbi:MAG TPA: DUF262 domain-containing HNH endonuclease family protein [Methanothrix sp.]|jgi:uncharacterized protein with ParB-like and HNH nuclease domain|nr:DUF262 domain-containing protein [Methanothrix sp.]HPC89658.1 DUF262 domain-containing HNH endonuclease family protein [Methanothrix sp.]HQI67986.1 DUF262 domain-containing HNH endonuclease family protein [Methanothrix sp.]HRS84928.1 DUF262 domain-containing HNH endonuclease family protein [Methanothrix sp.]HRT17173.1 DUF262 domain-containing HNH endonuclease family protein [Methanothrix sp.]